MNDRRNRRTKKKRLDDRPRRKTRVDLVDCAAAFPVPVSQNCPALFRALFMGASGVNGK